MTKSEKTRQYIIEQAANVFNQKGYAGTSITDIMNVTGLTKGGIYGNFETKEEIALEAFRYSVNVIGEQMVKAVQKKQKVGDKLQALIAFYKTYVVNPPIKGGCPILNTSIEADDTFPLLRQKAIKALNNWQRFVREIVEEGIKKKEIKEDVNAADFAVLFIALIEGAVMLSKTYGDSKNLNMIFSKVSTLVNELVK
ncbi:MAG: TetR/AcrR family transcriptional regulator [Cytophagaceae bacterium]